MFQLSQRLYLNWDKHYAAVISAVRQKVHSVQSVLMEVFKLRHSTSLYHTKSLLDIYCLNTYLSTIQPKYKAITKQKATTT